MSNCSWKQLRYDLRFNGTVDKIRCTFVRRAWLITILPFAFIVGLFAYMIFAVCEVSYDMYKYLIEPCWFGTYHNDDVEREAEAGWRDD